MTLRTRNSDIVDGNGDAIRLKGVNIGGWLDMENFSPATPPTGR